MHISNVCGNCAAQTRSRRREFSDQIWSVLITWGEVDRSLVDNPICDDCYNEFREVLIDRAQELEMALADPAKYHQMVREEQARIKKTAQAKPLKVEKTEKTAAKKKTTSDKKKKVATAAKKKVAKKPEKKPAKKVAKKKATASKKKTRKVGKLAS